MRRDVRKTPWGTMGLVFCVQMVVWVLMIRNPTNTFVNHLIIWAWFLASFAFGTYFSLKFKRIALAAIEADGLLCARCLQPLGQSLTVECEYCHFVNAVAYGARSYNCRNCSQASPASDEFVCPECGTKFRPFTLRAEWIAWLWAMRGSHRVKVPETLLRDKDRSPHLSRPRVLGRRVRVFARKHGIFRL